MKNKCLCAQMIERNSMQKTGVKFQIKLLGCFEKEEIFAFKNKQLIATYCNSVWNCQKISS